MMNTKRITLACSRLVRNLSHVASSEAASVPWKEIRVPVPWGQIAGKVWGVEDGEPVLAVHGWKDNCATFDRLAPLLPLSRLRLIALDLPGHGHSSHLPEGAWYRWSDYVTSIARVVDYLKLQQFSFLSHSMGAKISYIYAGCFPERVKSMVELDMPRPLQAMAHIFKHPKDVSNGDLTNIYRSWIETVMTHEQSVVETRGRSMEQWIEITMNSISVTRDTARVLLNRSTRQVNRDPDLYVSTHDRRLNIYDFLLASNQYELFFRRIACELLVLRFTKSITYYSEDAYSQKYFSEDFDMSVLDEFKKRLKVYRRECIEGNHYIHLNYPEKLSSIVGEFLLSSI